MIAAKIGPFSPFQLTMPAPAPRQAHETPLAYGARVLRFVMAERVTATVDDAGLEQALRAATLATAGPHYADRAQDAAHTADAAAQAKRLILAAQATRRQLCADQDAATRAALTEAPPAQAGPGPQRVRTTPGPTRPTPPSQGAPLSPADLAAEWQTQREIYRATDPRAALAARF